MAVLGVTMPSLADRLKRQNPDNSIADIVEMLTETNEVLIDAITVEGNLPTGHRTTVRTGLPSVTWRKLNYGVQPSKSTTKQVDDACGMLEGYAECDKSLADLNGDTARFRLSESQAFLESMNQEFSDTFIYGNTDTAPDKFMGLAPRYSVKSTDVTKSGYNIVDAGGTGSDNTSVWFVTWGENVAHLTYPKGSMMGLQNNDKGQVTLEDAAGGKYEGYRSHFKWDVGFVLRDWRGCARVANIDVSDLAAGTVAIDDYMLAAWYKIRKRPGKKAIYCNEQVMVALHKKAKDKTNVNLSIMEFEGRPVTMFLGVPIRQVDSILNTEARVV